LIILNPIVFENHILYNKLKFSKLSKKKKQTSLFYYIVIKFNYFLTTKDNGT